jgi:DNA-binding response OmpR family regulator
MAQAAVIAAYRRTVVMSPAILVVEDNAAHRRLFVRILTQAGYPVRIAADAEAALAAVAHEQPALVLTDLRLPPISGKVLVGARHRRYPQVRIVVTSALGAAAAIPGVPFLAKPVALADLLACVEDVLARESPSEPSQAVAVVDVATTAPRRFGA